MSRPPHSLSARRLFGCGPGGAPGSSREDAGRGARLARAGMWIVLLAMAALTVAQTITWLPPNWPREDWPRKDLLSRYRDFVVFMGAMGQLEKTGVLYDTESVNYFLPSSPAYKYPPTFAAVLRALHRLPLHRAMQIMVIALASFLLASLVLALGMMRLRGARALLVAILFLQWRAFWESMAGLQLETALLLLVWLGALLIVIRRASAAGFFVGIAAALKVYPLLLSLFFLPRRRGWGLAAVAAGGVFAALASCLALAPVYWAEYVTRILPRIGGTTLNPVNLSLHAFCARAALLVSGGPEKLREAMLYVQAESPAIAAADLAGKLAFVLLALLLAWFLARAVRRAADMDPARLDLLAYGLAVCFAVFVIPTSWPDYQLLLLVPLVIAIGCARAPAEDRVVWGLIVLASAPGVLLDANSEPFGRHAIAASSARALMPLLLGAALLALLRRTEARSVALPQPRS